MRNQSTPVSKKLYKTISNLIQLPLIIVMKYTILDVRYKHSPKFFCACCNQKITKWIRNYMHFFTFTFSIVWIAVFSYIMVWLATRVGETWNIDSSLMGLTFLAAGTRVPDLITSVIVARQGHWEDCENFGDFLERFFFDFPKTELKILFFMAIWQLVHLLAPIFLM